MSFFESHESVSTRFEKTTECKLGVYVFDLLGEESCKFSE